MPSSEEWVTGHLERKEVIAEIASRCVINGIRYLVMEPTVLKKYHDLNEGDIVEFRSRASEIIGIRKSPMSQKGC